MPYCASSKYFWVFCFGIFYCQQNRKWKDTRNEFFNHFHQVKWSPIANQGVCAHFPHIWMLYLGVPLMTQPFSGTVPCSLSFTPPGQSRTPTCRQSLHLHLFFSPHFLDVLFGCCTLLRDSGSFSPGQSWVPTSRACDGATRFKQSLV